MRSVARRMKKKRTPEIIKQEWFSSILEVFEEKDYLQMNKEVKNAKEPKDDISLVKKYEDLLERAKRKIRNIAGRQGALLKRFKNSEEFFDCDVLSRSNIYFRIIFTNFHVNFQHSKIQLVHLAILRAILS